jgi:hypothetical protein
MHGGGRRFGFARGSEPCAKFEMLPARPFDQWMPDGVDEVQIPEGHRRHDRQRVT